MGGAALALLPVLVLLGIGLWLFLGGVTFISSGRMGHGTEVHRPDERHELRYVVPEGLDPAPVLTALSQRGYEAALEEPEGRRIIDVTCPVGKEEDRDAIRAVIASAGATLHQEDGLEEPVRFMDEQAA
jgi:hypothetical protein